MSSSKNKGIFDFPHFKAIENEIGEIEQGRHYHFFTEGKWSMHETLLYLLYYSGPAKVTITSFSLSEITINTFVLAKEEGLITRLDLLLNTAVTRNKASLFFFAGNVADRIGLLDIHAKIIVIENDNWKIAVNQSANSTKNPAYEAGVICTVPEIVDEYCQKLDKAFFQSILF